MVWRQVYPMDESIYPDRDRAFLPLSCNRCDNPACLAACPTCSYEKRPAAIVVHHQETCIGCSNCIRSCPYGAPRFNKAEKHAEKCSLCHERLDAGLQPACVQACLTGALQLIDLNAPLPGGLVQYPAGYPNMPRLNPSTRFILPRAPRLARR